MIDLNTTTDLNTTLNHRLLESALLTRVPNDSLQLDDETLLAAINKQSRLTTQQAKKLLNSPLSILRFRHLYQAQQVQQQAWSGSKGLLLAAASEQDVSLLSTSDHLWNLHFLPLQQGAVNMVLKCQAGDEWVDQLVDAEQIIEVRDNKGHLICEGELDDAGELEAKWPFTLSPRQYFQDIGEGFVVRPKT